MNDERIEVCVAMSVIFFFRVYFSFVIFFSFLHFSEIYCEYAQNFRKSFMKPIERPWCLHTTTTATTTTIVRYQVVSCMMMVNGFQFEMAKKNLTMAKKKIMIYRKRNYYANQPTQ